MKDSSRSEADNRVALASRSWVLNGLEWFTIPPHLYGKISHVAGASRSGVIKALDRFSIPRENDRPVRTGHLPFGVDYISHQLVKNEAEKATIRMMQEQRAAGQSLREIVRSLNRAFIPIKQNGLW